MHKAEKPFSIDPHTLLRNDAPPEYRVFPVASINLLIHQDYASHGFKAVIKFYQDVIQFWNPGDVFGSADHLLEPIGRGRGVRHMLSRRFYSMTGKKGIYTCKIGLDKETHKALLLKHIRDSATEGARMKEFQQVLPSLSRQQIQRLLSELVTEGHIQRTGIKRAARWYPIGDD